MTYSIAGDRLRIDGKAVRFVRANSYSRGRMLPTAIVVHDTADRPSKMMDSVIWFVSKVCRVSAHFVNGRGDDESELIQLVDCDRKAYHAGHSSFKGRRSCNHFTVGIENDNPGKLDATGRAWFHYRRRKPIAPGFSLSELREVTTKEHGHGWWMPYTDAQIDRVIAMCRALVKAYPSIKDITTHWEIAPKRKVDTNPLFPLQEVRMAVFAKPMGTFTPTPIKDPAQDLPVSGSGTVSAKPEPETPKLSIGSEQIELIKTMQARLKALGCPAGDADGLYGAQMRLAVLGFEAENARPTDGELDVEDQRLLLSEAAKPMPIGERAEITAKELKKRGSPIAWCTQLGKRFLAWLSLGGTGTVVDAVVNEGEGVNTILTGLEGLRLIASRGSDLIGWMLTPLGLGIVGLVAVLTGGYFLLDWIERSYVKQARTAENVAH